MKKSPNKILRPRKGKAKLKAGFSVRKWDPLYIIFEKHLYDFNYESRDAFIKGVVSEYSLHLVQQKVVVPVIWKMHFETSIAEEVSDMLVRRLYGCLTVKDFKEKEEVRTDYNEIKEETKKRYHKLVG